jgi:hypothetical protein
MTTAPIGSPLSPRMTRGGLARLDPTTKRLLDVVSFQYNPDSVTRTLQPRAMTGEPGDRLEVLRLTGAPHETIKLEAEMDTSDGLETVDRSVTVGQHGLLPDLATLERLIAPTVQELTATDALFARGAMEIIPTESPLIVLIWGPDRVVPVTITSLAITEEAFDPALRPLRAKVSLECKVLTDTDFPSGHIGAALYLTYRQTAERYAALVTHTDVQPLGLARLP